jgi:ferric-chelate reductase
MPARASTRASNNDSGTVDVEALVFHTDLFLAALAVAYILAQLPALLARFSSGSEWRGWHLLRPSRVRAAEPLPYPRPLDSEAYTASNARRHIHDGEISEVHTDVSHTTSPISEPASQAHLKRRTTTAHRRLHKDAEGSPPRHVKAWSSRFPKLASILRHPLEQGTSVGQGLLLLVFTCVLVYPTLYHSNPFTDPLRAGYVALAQLPVVVALAVRNNPAGMLAGVSYEKVSLGYFSKHHLTDLITAQFCSSTGREDCRADSRHPCYRLWYVNYKFSFLPC